MKTIILSIVAIALSIVVLGPKALGHIGVLALVLLAGFAFAGIIRLLTGKRTE